MSAAEWLGFLAGLMVTSSLIPQLIRIFKLKSAREISFIFTTLMLLGVTAWMAYGLWLGLTSVIVWNAIGMCFSGTLLVAKFKYGR